MKSLFEEINYENTAHQEIRETWIISIISELNWEDRLVYIYLLI
jgi:hypothetical protein